MKNKVIVAGSDNVSAQQLQDLMRMIGDGTIDGRTMTSILANPRKFVTNSLTLVRAIKILGQEKVVSFEQATRQWPTPILTQVPMRCNEQMLREAAQANKSSGTDWRLVYVHGFSLREQRTHIGTDTAKQPCFRTSNTWWLDTKEDAWAHQKPEAGYYLLDFNGRFGRTAWQNQEDAIVKLGPGYERAHEAVVSEAALTIYKLIGERLLENWCHWGRSLDSYRHRVCVGYFASVGCYVGSDDPGYDGGGLLRVVVSRKLQR